MCIVKNVSENNIQKALKSFKNLIKITKIIEKIRRIYLAFKEITRRTR